jgi:alcohol dehydrogenase
VKIMEMTATGSWDVEFDSSRLVFGAGAAERLGELTAGLGCRRALIVTDPRLRAAGHVARARSALESLSIEAAVFDRVVENPTTRHVADGAGFAAERQVDCIVAVGGGSVLDCAKGINFLLTNGGKMEDYWGVGKATKPMLPSVGVPTTAGTGSDAQSFAVISQEETHAKMACGDRKAKFTVVILDPLLTITAPRTVTAIAGMDAISHAVESYVCNKRSPISQMLAREAWRLLEANLELVLDAPEDEAARAAMLLGSHLAGAAVEHSMLGAAHACANPLTARFQVTHGVAVSLMLPHVMRYNEAKVGNLYNDLSGGADGSLRERVGALRAAAGLPATLRECSIPRACLPELADDASSQWTAVFNPRPVTARDLLELYEAAF